MRRSTPFLWPFFLLLTATAWWGSGNATAFAGTLDGRVYVVETGTAGAEPDGRDVLLFIEGKFLSTFCHKYHGFQEGPYRVRAVADGLFFSADCFSDRRGSMHWEGTVRGNRIEVSYVWRDPPRWYRPWSSVKQGWAKSLTRWDSPDPETAGTTAVPSRQLDGRIFYVQAGLAGTVPDHEDFLLFWDGKFVSSGCVEYLFQTSAYSVTGQENDLSFHAETISPDYGVMIWNGKIKGDKIEATSRWMHQRWLWQIDRSYRYLGGLVEADATKGAEWRQQP